MDRQIRRLVLIISFLTIVVMGGVAGFSLLEHKSVADSLYFVIVTISTVGYGDVAPVTTAGRLIAIFLIICGVGSFVAVAAEIVEILLSRRERQEYLRKISMLLGVFFSETGNTLLKTFRDACPALADRRELFTVTTGWTPGDYEKARERVSSTPWNVTVTAIDLPALRTFLGSQRSFLVQLLQHPALFEHEAFTELLMAVFHLQEELEARGDFRTLPGADLMHLSGDAGRVLGFLVLRWLDYMEYLQKHYPYLFSLAVRMNPFNSESSPIIQG